MGLTAFDRHNELAPRLMYDLAHGTIGAGDDPEQMLVVLSSVCFGAIEMASRLRGSEELGRPAYLNTFVEMLSERVLAAQGPALGKG